MTEAEYKRRLVAILAADVAGYTRLMAANETSTLAALEAARLIFRDAIERESGRVVDMVGDSVLAVFDTATGAVLAGLATQKRLAADNDIPDDQSMRFRVGVHLGEVIEKPDGTVYGDGVNLAARLEGLAAPGGVCVSAAVADQIANKIADDFEDIGEHRVKNVAKPVHAFAWGGSSVPARSAERHKPTVVLGEFEARGGSDAEALAEGVKAGVATSLSNQTGVDLVSDPAEADFVVGATFQVHGGRYRASSRILSRATGSHFAADRFDGDLDDPFAAEDDLTYRVYNSVRFGLHRWEQEGAGSDPESLDTDESRILQAGKLMFRPYIEDFNEAGRLLDIVVANAPDNFMALAMKAGSLCGEFFAGYRNMDAGDGKSALEMAQNAVRLNGASDYAHWVLSSVLLICERDHEAAAAEARISLELNPFYAFATLGLSLTAITSGRVEEGMALSAKIATSDPRSQLLFWALQIVALGHFVAGRYKDAVDWAQRSDRRQQDVARTLLILAAALALDGEDQTARQAADRMMARYPDFHIAEFGNWPFMDPEPGDRIVEGLRLAGLPE